MAQREKKYGFRNDPKANKTKSGIVFQASRLRGKQNIVLQLKQEIQDTCEKKNPMQVSVCSLG